MLSFGEFYAWHWKSRTVFFCSFCNDCPFDNILSLSPSLTLITHYLTLPRLLSFVCIVSWPCLYLYIHDIGCTLYLENVIFHTYNYTPSCIAAMILSPLTCLWPVWGWSPSTGGSVGRWGCSASLPPAAAVSPSLFSPPPPLSSVLSLPYLSLLPHVPLLPLYLHQLHLQLPYSSLGLPA